MHIIVIVVNDIIVILKHISKLGTSKRLLNTKIEPNFEGSKKLNVDGGMSCCARVKRNRSQLNPKAWFWIIIVHLSQLRCSFLCSLALNPYVLCTGEFKPLPSK